MQEEGKKDALSAHGMIRKILLVANDWNDNDKADYLPTIIAKYVCYCLLFDAVYYNAIFIKYS